MRHTIESYGYGFRLPQIELFRIATGGVFFSIGDNEPMIKMSDEKAFSISRNREVNIRDSDKTVQPIVGSTILCNGNLETIDQFDDALTISASYLLPTISNRVTFDNIDVGDIFISALPRIFHRPDDASDAIYIKINDTDVFVYSSNMCGIVPIQSLKFPNFRVLMDACLKIIK